MDHKNLRNYSFSLPIKLMERLKQHVHDLDMPSINYAAREAFETYVRELDRLQYRAAMQKASRDPAFLRDVKDTIKDFSRIDQ